MPETSLLGRELLVPVLVGGLWYVAAPLFVRISDTRLQRRNPDHFTRLVRFSRIWGLAAVLIGYALSYLLRG